MSQDYNSVGTGLGLGVQVVASGTGLIQAIKTANTRGGGVIQLMPGVTYTWDGSLLSGEYENIKIVGAGPPSWVFTNSTGLVSDVTGSVISLINPTTADNTYYFNGVVFEDVVFTAPIAYGTTNRGLLGGNLNQNVWFKRCLIYDWVPPFRKNCGPNITMEDCSTFMSAAYGTAAGAGVTAITPTGSPFTYTNSSGSNQIVWVVGGTVSAQTVAGTAIPQQSTYGVRLSNGQSTVVTYSVAPTMFSTQMAGNVQGDQGPSWFTRCTWDYHPSQEFAVGFAGYSSAPNAPYYFEQCGFGSLSQLYSMDAWVDTESNPETAITVTASIFSWQNNATNNPAGGNVQVYVRSGTVSLVTVTGGSPTVTVLAANYGTGTTLKVGDTINVTYSAAPTMAYMNQYLPECVVRDCKLVNGKIYAVNFGKYSILDSEFILNVNYNGQAPHFVHTYNPTANPGSGGHLIIRGNTFRQPQWISSGGTALTPVADPVALALFRDGALMDLTVEDNTFFLSNKPSGTDNAVRPTIEVAASANCPGIGTVTIRHNKFGFVETGGTSSPIVQVWSDTATTGGGIDKFILEELDEIAASGGVASSAGGIGDGITPALVAPVYTWPLNIGLAAKTTNLNAVRLRDSYLPNSTNFPFQKLGTWTLGTGSVSTLDVRNFGQRFASADIAGASPLTVGPFGNVTAYTQAIKQPAIVIVNCAATTSITVTLQTAGGTTRTVYPTGVPTATVPLVYVVAVGDVLTMTWTVAQPTHVWVLPFSTGL